MGVPVLKMTAAEVPARPYPRNGHAVGDAEMEPICAILTTVADKTRFTSFKNKKLRVISRARMRCALARSRQACIRGRTHARTHALQSGRMAVLIDERRMNVVRRYFHATCHATVPPVMWLCHLS